MIIVLKVSILLYKGAKFIKTESSCDCLEFVQFGHFGVHWIYRRVTTEGS